jgi:hypothetical protein
LGVVASSITSGRPVSRLYSSGSTLQKSMSVVSHCSWSGELSLMQSFPSPFFCTYVSPDWVTALMSTLIMPSVTTVDEEPITGLPQASSKVARTRLNRKVP